VPFTAALEGLKAINPHTKYLETWYKVSFQQARDAHRTRWQTSSLLRNKRQQRSPCNAVAGYLYPLCCCQRETSALRALPYVAVLLTDKGGYSRVQPPASAVRQQYRVALCRAGFCST
jgi:hypothetical protein